MKLQTNSNIMQIWEKDYIISNQILTRDFKSFPLLKSYNFTQYSNYNQSKLFHYKNPILFNPIVSSSTLDRYTYNSVQGAVIDNIPVSLLLSIVSTNRSVTQNGYSYTSDKYDDVSTLNNFPLVVKEVSSKGYRYGHLRPSNSSKYSGLYIYGKQYFYIYQNASDYYDSFQLRLLKDLPEKDIVGIDINVQGYGVSMSGSPFVYSDFGFNGADGFCNNFTLFSLDKEGNKGIYTGTLDTDWYTAAGFNSYNYYCLSSKCSNMLANEDNTYTLYHVRPIKSSPTTLGLWKLVVNDSTTSYIGSFTTLDVAIPYTPVKIQDSITVNKLYTYHSEFMRDGNKTYVSIIILNGISAENVGVYTYEVDEATNIATFKGSYKNSNNYVMNYFMIDSKTMLTSSPLGYEILSFDTITGVWKKTAGKDLSLDCIVYDDVSNALFYLDTSNTAYMDKLDLAMTADWGWSNPNQTWEGSTIDTTLYMSCADYTGKLISQNVTLYIEGNAVFTENNLKSITVSTSATDKILIPVQITGDGVITVSAKAAI